MASGKFDPGYSFRSSDFRSQSGKRPRRQPPAPASGSVTDEGHRPCARGQWCASSVTILEGGQSRREPAPGPRSFCDGDRGHIARCLEELPEQYVRLAAELGSPSARGVSVRIPFGPRIPIRVDIDALMKLMAESLISWHERVAAVARLDFPDARRREGAAVQRAQLVLSARLDALLGLPGEPMSRAWDLHALPDLPAGASGIVRSVFVDATIDLSGADAGLEILHLRYLARALLGETKARPEELTGVPCRDPEGTCGWRTVYRAELPSHEDEPVWWTECARCGDRLTEEEYREWVALCAAYERNRRKEPATLENLPGVA